MRLKFKTVSSENQLKESLPGYEFSLLVRKANTPFGDFYVEKTEDGYIFSGPGELQSRPYGAVGFCEKAAEEHFDEYIISMAKALYETLQMPK